MRKLEYSGHFYDGETPKKYSVEVTLQADGILIKSDEFNDILWLYSDIKQSPELYSGTYTQLENTSFKNQRLVIEKADFLSVVKEFFPGLKISEPQKMISVRRVAVLGLVLLLILIPTFYFFLLPSFSEIIAERIPVSFEKRLSAPYISMMAPKKSLCNDTVNYSKLESIFNKLTGTIPDSRYDFKLFIVKSDILNAFALPGGYVVIYSGLLEKTDRPEQLAGVLAHELQHITERHGTEALVKDYSLGFIISAVTNNTQGMERTFSFAKYLGLMKYSRESETEADTEGIDMMKRAEIDPKGMVEFFEILNKHTGDFSDSFEYISTHPQTKDRIYNLRELSKSVSYDPVSLYSKKEWEEIKKVCDDKSIEKFSFWNLN